MELDFTLADDQTMTLAYKRSNEDAEVLVIFNRSESTQEIDLQEEGSYELLLETGKSTLSQVDNGIKIELEGLQGVALRKKNWVF